MIRRIRRWCVFGVALTVLLAAGAASAAQPITFENQTLLLNTSADSGDSGLLLDSPVAYDDGAPGPGGGTLPMQEDPATVPYFIGGEPDTHEKLAIMAVYGDSMEAMPEQQALTRAVAVVAPERATDRVSGTIDAEIQWTRNLPYPIWRTQAATRIAVDLTVHERAAMRAIFGTDDLAVIDAADDVMTMDRPVIISASPTAVNAAAVRGLVVQMTIHEQLALRAIYGDVRLEPSPVQDAIAPYAELITKGDVTSAELPWRPRLRAETVASLLDVHQKAAVLSIFGDGFAPRDPERQAVAPIASLLSTRVVAHESLAPADLVDTLSLHEQAAIRAVFGEGFVTGEPERSAVAPMANIVGARIKVLLSGSDVEIVNAMSVHEKLAMLAVLGDGFTADDPEQRAVATLAALVDTRLPCTGMDTLLADLSTHERASILAICGNHLWAKDCEQCASQMAAALIRAQSR